MPKKSKARASAIKPQHRIFALTYLANGGNATAAYEEVYPSKTRKAEVTHAAASRLLSSVKVQALIERHTRKMLQRAEATADEAMDAISRTLRLDPRMMLDEKGKPLAMKDWPDDVALVVKSIKGDGTVVFYDKFKAAELIAESHGRIKKKRDISIAFDHVKYLADKSRPKDSKG